MCANKIYISLILSSVEGYSARLLIYILFFFCAQPAQGFTIHVLLEKKESNSALSWEIISNQGVLVSDPYQPACQDRLADQLCNIRYKNKALWIGSKKLAINRVKITPLEGMLTFAGKPYTGSLSIIFEENFWHVINNVDLEEYVCSVLRAESWPGWPLEVNKAFAIMHRSYAVAKILQSRQQRKKGKKIIWDIGCTNKDQTYHGFSDFPILKQAAEETRDIVMVHQKKPIMAMYDTCCGGLIPAKMKGVDFKSSPYLARAYPCTFCTNCKVYSWKITYPIDMCQKLFNKAGVNVKNMRAINVSRLDPAGIVEEIKLKCGNHWTQLTGKQVYGIFKDIKSFSFSISQHAASVTFTGIGYGHHLGLCQWGARQMIAEGWKFDEVLKFYYPGTSFMRLDMS